MPAQRLSTPDGTGPLPEAGGPWTLTVDVGNSRTKACLHPPGRREPELRAALDAGQDLAGLESFLAGRRLTGAALASVRGAGSLAPFVELLAARVEGPLLAPPDPGLVLDVEHPETVGLDRLLAARAALARTGRASIVVDAGTALTVDAVLAGEEERGPVPRLAPRRPDEPRGVFLGGAIAPGPALLARALATGGAQLRQVEPRPGSPALGRHTAAALEAGIAVGLAGAARELVERLREETGLRTAPLVLTGGARAFLRGVLGEPLEVEDLVHEGLWLALAREGVA